MQFSDLTMVLGAYLEYEVPYIFEELDEGDAITHSAYIRKLNCTAAKCLTKLSDVEGVSWVMFDSQRNLLFGKPQPHKDIAYHSAS